MCKRPSQSEAVFYHCVIQYYSVHLKNVMDYIDFNITKYNRVKFTLNNLIFKLIFSEITI